MHKFAVEQAGPPGVGGEEPDDEGHLNLIVEGKPAREGEKMGSPRHREPNKPTPAHPGAVPAHQPHQEMSRSVKVSVAMKSAKTIQYIIQRTCGERASLSVQG